MGWLCVDGKALCNKCKQGYRLSTSNECEPCPVLPRCLVMTCSTYDTRCSKCETHYVTTFDGTCTFSYYSALDRFQIQSSSTMYASAADINKCGCCLFVVCCPYLGSFDLF
jgi:hypothetical protein